MRVLLWQDLGTLSCPPDLVRLTAVSSPGALIAGTWAAMQYMGHKFVKTVITVHYFLNPILQRVPRVLPVHCWVRQKNRGSNYD